MKRCLAPLAGVRANSQTSASMYLMPSEEQEEKPPATTPPHGSRPSAAQRQGGLSVHPSAHPAVASTVLSSQHQQLSFPENALLSQEHQCTLVAALPVQLLIQTVS